MRETISIAFVNNHMCIYPHILMDSMHFHYINPFNKRQVNEFADPFKNLRITGSHQITRADLEGAHRVRASPKFF